MHSVGYAHLHLGQLPEATAYLGEALVLARTIGERHFEATVLTDLGETHLAAGDTSAARHTWRQALRLLCDLDHPDAEQVQIKLDALRAGGA